MDLWTDRFQTTRAFLPWITTKSLPTAPPSDHKSTDPQTQCLSYMGSKATDHLALVPEGAMVLGVGFVFHDGFPY